MDGEGGSLESARQPSIYLSMSIYSFILCSSKGNPSSTPILQAFSQLSCHIMRYSKIQLAWDAEMNIYEKDIQD